MGSDSAIADSATGRQTAPAASATGAQTGPAAAVTGFADLAVVAIGRNEGERLQACLASVRALVALVVYVDSGSTDGSLAHARALGAEVVELDLTIPFTAARARNAGYRRVREIAPQVRFVHFVDGDCIILDGWLAECRAFLAARPDFAAVCGRRRERFPERSVYNWLIDIEWGQHPPGLVSAFGGDVLLRVEALDQLGGYREDLIAGEEPELGVRLRARDWKLWRIDRDMTGHDAAMVHFSQWWKRSVRTGFAFAEGAWLHGGPPERHWVRPTLSNVVWGLMVPLLALSGAVLLDPLCLLLLLIYPLQVARMAVRSPFGVAKGATWAFFIVLSKFPQTQGALQFGRQLLTRRRSALIEYK